MVEATRAYVAAEAVRTLKQSVSLGAFSWKFCRNYYATDLGAQAATQFGAVDPFNGSYARARARPAPHEWAPEKKHSCRSAWAHHNDVRIFAGV